MAKRIHALCEHVVEHYDGDAQRIWQSGSFGPSGVRPPRCSARFGPEKTKITLAILAKRFGRAVPGWQELVAPFDDEQPRSVADVGSSADLARLRAHRAAQKEAGKTKTDCLRRGRCASDQPAQQHRHRSWVVTQQVASTLDDSKLRRSMGLGHHPGVYLWNY